MTGVISFIVDATGRPQAVSATNPLPVTSGSGASATHVQGTAADGTAPVGNPVLVAGYDGALVQSLSVNSAGDLNARVQGNVSSGSADGTSLPVKVGGRYNATLPTFADGQRGDLQISPRGSLEVAIMSATGSFNDFSTGSGDTIAASTGGIVVGANLTRVLNAAGTWDRQRGSAGEGTITKPYAFGANSLRNRQSIAAATTTQIFAAAGANIRNCITSITISQPAAAVANVVSFLDGAGNVFEVAAPAGAWTEHFTFPNPIRGSVNTAFSVVTSTAGPITLSTFGYTVTE